MRYILIVAFLLTGIAASAQLLEKIELNPGPHNSDPISFTVFNNKLYFYAIDDEHGRELWEYNDTMPPRMVIDLYPGTVGIASNGQSPFGILDGQMYFSGNRPGVDRRSLFRYPGSNGTPEHVPAPAPFNVSEPNYFFSFEGKLYFYSVGQVVSYDPAANAFRQISTSLSHLGVTGRMTAYKGKVYFPVGATFGSHAIGSYDPRTDQAEYLPITAVSRIIAVRDIIVFGDKLYFIGKADGGDVPQLYQYDEAGDVVQLTQFKTDSAVNYYGLPSSICVYRNKLYFNAIDGDGIGELFSYDPATGIAARVSDINTGKDAAVFNCVVYKDKLYFTANDGVLAGSELWVYDEQGPPRVIDVYPGNQSSWIEEKIVYNGSLYFGALSNTGIELFKYTDTTAVPDTLFAEGLVVYPVPCSTEVNVMFTLSGAKDLCVRLVDMAGHVLYNGGLQKYKKGRNYMTIPIGHLPAANYIIQVQRSTNNTFRAARLTKL